MLLEIRPLPSTSKTSPGRRVSRKAVESFGVNGSLLLAGCCNRAIKRPTMSNIQPMARPHLLMFPTWQFPDSSSAARELRPKPSHRETDPTIVRRVGPYLHFGEENAT